MPPGIWPHEDLNSEWTHAETSAGRSAPLESGGGASTFYLSIGGSRYQRSPPGGEYLT